MVVEHAHGLRQRRGPNAKSSLHKAHLAPDAGLQAPGASLSFAQGSHDFESLDRGIGRGDRFETAHRLDQYLELSVIGLDHVIEILHLPVGRLPVQLSFALQFGDRCTIARRFVGIERGRLFPVLQASQGLAQEPLRCLGAAGRRQVEIDRVAPLVDCPVQVGPLAPHLDVGFIQGASSDQSHAARTSAAASPSPGRSTGPSDRSSYGRPKCRVPPAFPQGRDS